MFARVRPGKIQHTFGRQSVAPGPSGFLVVAFHGLGQIRVRDQPHVGFVYAHAKGDGGGDDGNFITDKFFLRPGAFAGIKTGMVGQGGKTQIP